MGNKRAMDFYKPLAERFDIKLEMLDDTDIVDEIFEDMFNKFQDRSLKNDRPSESEISAIFGKFCDPVFFVNCSHGILEADYDIRFNPHDATGNRGERNG